MKNSIKILISEYTILSIIMSAFLPIYVHAEEINSSDFGSNIVFSEGENNTDIILENTPQDASTSGETAILPMPEEIENNSDTGSVSDTGVTADTGVIVVPIEIPEKTNIEESEETITTPPVEEIAEEKIMEEQVAIKETEGDILVQFKSDITSTVGQYQVEQLETSLGLETTDTIPENNIAIMQSTSSSDLIHVLVESSISSYEKTDNQESTDRIIEELKKDPNIEHVQRNFIYEITATNDPDYSKLWSLENQGQTINGTAGSIDADVDYPEAINYASGKLGSGVIVAVLDTGITYNHPDLSGHMWNGSNCLSDTGMNLGGCIHGYDFVNNDTNPNDGHYHGTHVAGTIGAVSDNTIGLLGVAPNVSLMAVKILDDKGRGSTASIIRGINFAKYNGARVINASFGGVEQINSESEFDQLSYNAIKNFPGLFVAAAGNDGANLELRTNTKNYPSGFGSDTLVSGEIIVGNVRTLTGTITIPGLSNVIAVAASTQTDSLASFSNYGTGTVHIAAPGTNTWSSIPVYTTQSGAIDTIRLNNGWSKNATGTLDNWDIRPNITTSGESIDLSNALWGNKKTPYVSGETTYIEKSFGTITGNVGSIGLNIWCDTPSSNFYKDYIEVLVSTGGVYQSVKKIDEDIIAFSQGKDLVVDSHTGKYQRYNIVSPVLSSINNTTLNIRILWRSDSIDDVENTIAHYGCAVENLNLNTMNESYDYKYSNGTSMAAPHVAGAAALAWSYKSNASISEVRSAMILGGESKIAFENKISSGKRLNLLGMLQVLEQSIGEAPKIITKKITLSGESTAIINFTSDIEAKSEILYGTGLSVVLSGGILQKAVSGEISGNSKEYKAILTRLTPDTPYYYRITMTSLSGGATNPEFYTPYTFVTPKVTTTAVTAPITVASGEIYLSGSTASGVTMSGSTSSGFLILKSVPAKITTTIPALNLQILSTSGSWNGMLSAPRIENTGGVISLSGNTSVSSQLMFNVGNITNNLVLVGQLASISVTDIVAQSGSIVSIYYTPNTSTKFIKIGQCIITTNICTFTTNYLGVFALGNMEIPPVTPPITPAPTCTISINPTSVVNGSGATLSWSLSGSLTGVLNPGNTILGSSGSVIIIPPPNATTPYILTVTNSGGTSSCTASVISAPVVIVPPVTPPVTPPVNPPSGGGGSSVGPGGGGGGGSSSSQAISSNTASLAITPILSLPIMSTSTKTISKKILGERNQLNISIRSLQAKLNKKTVSGESRRNIILELQEFYKEQIKLMRERAGK
ncbi:S8 family serine peptidase [Candidatus Gracilibacteria bacterium]|nr:S8 family serine peptidase [Candidatus Gracilibacteria bacterium]